MKKRGSCLCGAFRFSIDGEVARVGQCHCSQCRKVSGTNGNAMTIVSKIDFEWLAEEAETERFSLPSGWSCMRCGTCGSPLPDSHDEERGLGPGGPDGR